MVTTTKINKDKFINMGFKTKKEALEYAKKNDIKTIRGETEEAYLVKLKNHFSIKKSNDDYKKMIELIDKSNTRNKIEINNTNFNYNALCLAINYAKQKLGTGKFLYHVEYQNLENGSMQYRTFIDKEFKCRKISENVSDYGSDTENKLLNYEIIKVTIELLPNNYQGYQKKRGAFFKYYNNTIIELSRFGIFKNNDEADYIDSCFINTLKQSMVMTRNRYQDKNDIVSKHLNKLGLNNEITNNKIDDKTLESIILNLKNREIKIEELSKIGEKYNILFHFFYLDKDEVIKSVLYGDKSDTIKYVIPICLYEKHYMIYDDIEYSNYFISNYIDVENYVNLNKKELEAFTCIKRKLVKNTYEKSKEPLYSNILFTIKHLMKQGLFTLIPSEDVEHLDFNNYFDIDNIEINEHHLEDITKWSLKTYNKQNIKLPNLFENRDLFNEIHDSKDRKKYFKTDEDAMYFQDINKMINNRKYSNIIFADFESVDNNRHQAYMCAYSIVDWEDKQAKKDILVGFDCARQFLEAIPDKSIVYFHNCKYDMTFMFDLLTIVQYVEKDNQLYEAIVSYKKKSFKIRDSYKYIPEPLGAFEDMFKLDCKKEIFPYDHYNYKFVDDIINNRPHKLTYKVLQKQASKKDMSDEELTQFIDYLRDNHPSIIGHNDKTLDALEYAKFYCEQDVRVLQEGFLTFRKALKKEMNIDIHDHLTISGVAEKYLINQGCYDDIYEVSGLTRLFIEKSIVGGRVMSARNETVISEEGRLISDFDVTSLYPAAMNQMKGFAKGKGIIITNEQWHPDLYELYYVEIELLDAYYNREDNEKIKCIKHDDTIITDRTIYDYDFGLFNEKDSDGVLHFSNKPKQRKFVVQNEQMQDLIKFYNLERDVHYKFIKGIYFPDGYNDKIKSIMRILFDTRNKYKKDKNPIQVIYKLIMNASYGKTILKQTDYKVKIMNNSDEEDYNNYLIKNYNRIKEIESYPNHKIIKEYTALIDHKNCAHIGSHVLAQSKKIMNEIFYYCHHNGLKILYQDTDSCHLYQNHCQYLPKKFIGEDLGLFHNDFSKEYISKFMKITNLKELPKGEIFSKRLYVLGKKMYCDELIYTGLPNVLQCNTNDITVNHIRFKGCDTGMIEEQARIQNLTIPQLYEKMIHDKNKGGVYAEFSEINSNKPHFKYEGRNKVCNKKLSEKKYTNKNN